VPEDGGLIGQALIGLKPVNVKFVVTPTLPPLILHMILRRRLTLILVLDSFFFFAFVGAYRVCFFSLSFCFRSPPASYMEGMYMEGTSLTTPPSIPDVCVS